MEDIKVVAWQEDIDAIENTIKKRTGNTEKLSFPDGFVGEIGNIKGSYDMYLNGETIKDYTCEAETIPQYFIAGCKSLEIINFPNATNIGSHAMASCDNLTEVNAPNLESLAGWDHFFNCSSLKKVNMPKLSKFINSFAGLMDGTTTFGSCTALEEIYLPKLETLSHMMFSECSSLITACLPTCHTLGSCCFEYCESLKTVLIPSAKIMQFLCFNGCYSIESIVIEQTESICEITCLEVFENCAVAAGTGFIYVPDELLQTYKTATNWSVFANQIKPLSEYTQI